MNPKQDLTEYVVWPTYGNMLDSQKTEKKLIGFEGLRDGWHYGQGKGFSSDFIHQALQFHRLLVECGCSDTDAFPGIDGSIQISVYQLPRSCEITFSPDGKWSVVLEHDGKELSEAYGDSFPDWISALLTRITSWNMSTSWRFIIGNPSLEDFPAKPLSLPLTEEFPSLSWNVLEPQESRYADISDNFTLTSQENLRSSGFFRLNFYQTPYISSKR